MTTSEYWPRLAIPPRLVGSTGDTYQCSIAETQERELLQNPAVNVSAERQKFRNGDESNVFKSAQWTPDGTTLLTHNEDETLRTFILPPDLLDDPSSPPKRLQPYSKISSPSRIYSTAIYPLASLSTPSTFVFLSSPRDSPIRLHSLLHPTLVSSYPLVNPQTEKFLAPYSLLIPPSRPNIFLAGTSSQISIFDLHRDGDAPTTTLKTIPTRKSPATTTTMKGLITAMALTPDAAATGAGVLAAGTYSRQVGLYADDGMGETIGVFHLPDTEEAAGGGVTQLLWSEDGRYLYIAERRSMNILVYDIRVTGKMVESFRGRFAETNQRLGVDLATGLGGEMVAGGTDGVVRIWEAGHAKEGLEVGESVGSWKAHEDAATTATVHPFGSVMATCSGARKTYGLDQEPSSGSDSESSYSTASSGSNSSGDLWDNSLKIWELPRKSLYDDSTRP